MAKRGATTDINHDNWDQPLEEEEAGSFKTATEDELRGRVIKTAKRKLKSSGSTETGNLFASFGGFKPSTTSSTNTSNVFGFLGKSTSNNESRLTPSSNLGISKSQGTNGASSLPSQPTESKVDTKQSEMQSTPHKQYLSKLQELNRSVLDWLKTHVEANPYCILTPVFNDYDKYLKQLQEDRDTNESKLPVSSAPTSLSSFSFVSSSTSANKFPISIPPSTDNSSKTSLTESKPATSSSNDDKTSLTIFGMSKDSGKSPLSQGEDVGKAPTPSLFGSIKSDSTASSFFTKPDPASLMVNPFTSVIKKDNNSLEAKPFSFSNGSTTTSSVSAKDDNEEEEVSEEPPKVEFTPVEEENSVFSTRCKVFVKKETNYMERGVGTLYIKKVGENKHQLLVRAETVLGNVLLNVLLSSGIPTERKGPNNVMLVCIPTPQDPPPPTVVLLRVKTSSEADQLLETIQKYQN